MTTPVAFPGRSHIQRLFAGAVALAVASSAVVVIDAEPAAAAPAYGAPDDIAADYYEALLRHTPWVNSVWDDSIGAYQSKDFNFAVVLGNAVLVTQGDYDESLAGVPREELRAKTIATIEHYAALNRLVNPNGTWGKRMFWDSTFQSYFLDAGRLMWDDLSPTTQSQLTAIAVGQSTYVADLHYGDDPMSGSWTADWPTGKYAGDTAQEESGVYTQALAPGLAWDPSNADAARWAEQFGDWVRNAAGQPTADTNNPAIVAGKPISTNTMQTIYDTYLVENHGSFGPHYQSDIWRSGGRNAIQFILNGEPVPDELLAQPNSAQLWESIKLMMTKDGEPFMPMVADREHLYGRDVIPLAFLGQVLRDPDAARAEQQMAASLAPYQGYAPVYRLAKFSGEPKYEPEARAEIAIAYLLHVAAANSAQGPVEPTPVNEYFARLAGVRDFGDAAGFTVQQTETAWAGAASRNGFVKFPWVPGHDAWLFDISGNSTFLYPRSGDAVDGREAHTYTHDRDGFDATSTVLDLGTNTAGMVTLPTGAAIYATTGAGIGDGSVMVRNLDMDGHSGLDGSRDYTTASGTATAVLPPERVTDPADANAARIDDLTFSPVTARYVRMQGIAGNPSYGYSMYSFHVYDGTPGASADLASGKSASASSADTGRAAGYVTDASASTRWAVSKGDRTRGDSWIQVDLGAEQTVASVALAWESSAGVNYLLQTSTDGSTWTTQATYGGGDPADANVARLDNVDLAPAGAAAPGPVEARYVRMQGLQGDPGYGYSLYHFRVFDGAGANVAAGVPATASSADGSHPAASVTDGSASTRWAVSRDDRTRSDSWIQVDLGAAVDVTRVQLGWEAAAGRMYRVQVSLDGDTWTDAATFRYTGDQITSTDGTWLNVDGQGGFVVRGTDAPITVSADTPQEHVIRLNDVPEGAHEPFLVEMIPGDAAATRTAAQRAGASVDAPGVLASTLDGYVTVFNLTDDPVTAHVTLPHGAGAIPLFVGTQTVSAGATVLEVTVPAASAIVLSPRATFEPSGGAVVGEAHVTLPDASAVEGIASSGDIAGTLRNLQTGATEPVTFGAVAAKVTFAGAKPYPDEDLAVSRLTFPASVLPSGMSDPAAAVDSDVSTSWTPGPDGRMVVDLGEPMTFAQVAVLWDGSKIPDATVSVSDDGFTFTDIGQPVARGGVAIQEANTTARYVALSTQWTPGDATVASLRVLPQGVEQEQQPTPIAGTLPASWEIGSQVSAQLASHGTPAPTFRVSDGALPDGIALDSATGTLAGKPTQVGTFSFTIAASNGVGDEQTRAFSVEVFAAAGPGDGGTGGTGGAGAGGGQGGGLAFTGADVNRALAVTLSLLLAGAALVAVGHRRRGRTEV